MTRAGAIVLGFIAMGLVSAGRPAVGTAAELCRARSKGLVVRDVCKPHEQTLGPTEKAELGLGGKTGSNGPAGPPMNDLRVLDADGDEVGVVTSTLGYYGSVTAVGRAVIPNLPDWIVANLDGNGLATSNLCSDVARLYRTPDCLGEALVPCFDCDGPGTVFAREVYRQDATTGCYLGSASESETQEFFQRLRTFGSTLAQAQQACVQQGGTPVGTPTQCGQNLFCGQCCHTTGQNTGVPLHYFDSSVLGTPPFRLAR